jgi:hypothetical protein
LNGAVGWTEIATPGGTFTHTPRATKAPPLTAPGPLMPHTRTRKRAQAPEGARRFHIPASDAPGALDVYNGRELLGTVPQDDHAYFVFDASYDAALAAIPDKGQRA